MKHYLTNRGGYWILLISNILALSALGVLAYKTDALEKLLVKLHLKEKEISDISCDYRAIDGWTNTLQQLDYKADIAFFGSSSIRYGDFKKYFPDKRIVNLGYPGDTTKGMVRRINMLRAINPDKVFVYGGLNGLVAQSPDQFSQWYETMADSVRKACPKADLYLLSILPINHAQFDKYGSNKKIRGANEIISRIAKEKGMIYVDLFSLYCINGDLPDELTRDGVHLQSEAYDRWADAIQKYVEH